MWTLPASKTDCTASSVSPTCGRLCQDGVSAVCPAHLAVDHPDSIRELFPDHDGALPLFPDLRGQHVTKAPVVDTTEAIAVKCDLAIRDPQGRPLFGEYSLRITGAKYLAGIGLELHKLSLLAIWSSDVILRYVGEAPLTSLTNDCRPLVRNGSRQQQQVAAVKSKQREVHPLTEEVNHRLDLRNAEDIRLAQLIDETALNGQTSFVQNATSGVWHKVLSARVAEHRSTWRTAGGWRFSAAKYRIAPARPADPPNGCIGDHFA